ncbi:MAG TPA: transglycosylase domain-containing protein, partial [Armatimonadota bacterium]|nr:transglycosylase domain-containing protein [Armatimonadota bacterium]
MSHPKPRSHPSAAPARRPRRKPRRKRGWKFFALVAFSGPLLLLAVVLGYYYVHFSRMIDARIQGKMQHVDPRVFARPFALRRGQSMTPHQLVDRLNELGYANRPTADQPGEFTVGRDALLVVPRDGPLAARQVRVVFAARRAEGSEPTRIDRIEVLGDKSRTTELALGAPLITALVPTRREKRRDVPIAAIPPHMVNAVLAIEDRRFYDHPGIDPIAISAAVFSNVFGRSTYTRGGSTL